MADIAERGVMFVLKASLDPAARTLISSFGKEVEAIQTRSAAATVENSRKAIAIAAQEARATVDIFSDADSQLRAATNARAEHHKAKVAEEEAVYKASLERRNKAAEEFAIQQDRAGMMHAMDEPIDVEAYSAATREAAEAIDEFNKLEEARTKKHETETKKRLDQDVKLAEKRKSIEDREAAALAKKYEAQRSKDEEALAQSIAIAEKQVEVDRKKRQAESEAAAKAYKNLAERAADASRSVTNKALEMSESIMKFARGLTAIGLVGEEDINKVKDALLTMQGSLDIFTGLGRIITKTSEIMRGLTKATTAQAAAQAALNAINASGGAAGVAGAAGGAAGGLGGAGLLAGAAAILTGPFAAVAAGALAVGGAFVFLQQTMKDIPNQKKGDNSARGMKDLNFSQWLGASLFAGSSTSAGNTTGSAAKKDLIESEKTTNRLSRNSEQFTKMNDQDRAAYAELESKRTGEMQRQKSIQEAMLHNRYEQATAAEKTKIIEQQIAKHVMEANKGDPSARGEVIKWLEKRLSHEREIARETKHAAQESLKSSQDQLRSVEQQIAAKREANMSSAESFGMKSEEDQQDILSIGRRIQQGDKSLTPEEIQKAKGFSSQTDSKISQFARNRAQSAGFQGVFGKENDQDIQKLDAVRKKLQLEVKQKTDVVVKIDRDIEAEAQQIAKMINVQQAIQDSALAKRVQEIAAEQKTLNQRFSNRTGVNIQ